MDEETRTRTRPIKRQEDWVIERQDEVKCYYTDAETGDSMLLVKIKPFGAVLHFSLTDHTVSQTFFYSERQTNELLDQDMQHADWIQASKRFFREAGTMDHLQRTSCIDVELYTRHARNELELNEWICSTKTTDASSSFSSSSSSSSCLLFLVLCILIYLVLDALWDIVSVVNS